MVSQATATRKYGLKPDPVSFVTAINAAGQALALPKAEAYFEAMQAAKFAVEERTW